jgi:hypothetical protein
MSLRAWLATRFSLLLFGAMLLFVTAIYLARQAGAYGEAANLAQERARLAQLILRQLSYRGLIRCANSGGDSFSPIEYQRGVQMEPRVRELLNVVDGYIWVLSDTILYASVDARQLDSATLKDVNESLKELRGAQAPSRRVPLGRRGLHPARSDGRAARDAPQWPGHWWLRRYRCRTCRYTMNCRHRARRDAAHLAFGGGAFLVAARARPLDA